MNAAEAQRDRDRRTAFSLLEVLIAMIILSIGAASVLSLFAAAANTHKRSVDRTHAALVAEGIFAEIQALYIVGMSVADLNAAIQREIPAQSGDYTWEAYLHQPGRGEQRTTKKRTPRRAPKREENSDEPWRAQELIVRVLVRWKRSGHARSESSFTILLPRNADTGTKQSRPSRRTGLRRR